jgi:hypothetical protein
MRRQRTLTILTTVLGVVGSTAALLVGAASARPQPVRAHAAAATQVVRLRPVDAHGHLRAGYTITHRHGRAHCVLGSEAIGAAYRCFAGDAIFDPCWVQAGADHSHVICLGLPWTHDVFRVHVTRGYDNSVPATRAHYPWGLRLTRGTRCARVQGATGRVHGRPVTYFCPHSKLMLLGEPNRSKPQWTIRTARPTHDGLDQPSGRKAISKAFFGRPSLIG